MSKPRYFPEYPVGRWGTETTGRDIVRVPTGSSPGRYGRPKTLDETSRNGSDSVRGGLDPVQLVTDPVSTSPSPCLSPSFSRLYNILFWGLEGGGRETSRGYRESPGRPTLSPWDLSLPLYKDGLSTFLRGLTPQSSHPRSSRSQLSFDESSSRQPPDLTEVLRSPYSELTSGPISGPKEKGRPEQSGPPSWSTRLTPDTEPKGWVVGRRTWTLGLTRSDLHSGKDLFVNSHPRRTLPL